jgi:L-alanine-DL-glutamate epimerase-like enolase superfamily enzyme
MTTIVAISVFKVDLPHPDSGSFRISGGRSHTSFDDTIVEIETDQGITGWGETCPYGSTYVAAFAEGARAAIGHLAPHILGADASRPEPLYRRMDSVLTGHGYTKAAIDMACWDILGQMAGLPLCDLWGGRFEAPLPLSGGLVLTDLDDLEGQLRRVKGAGCRDLGIKMSGDPGPDLEALDLISRELGPSVNFVADVNGGWLLDDAVRIGQALQDRPMTFEQPCRTYEACRLLRQRIPQGIILDEVALDVETALRARADGLLEQYNLKTAKAGGLTKARKLRDLCVAIEVPIKFQDTWGAELTKAGMLHLAQSTPARYRTEFWNVTDNVGVVTCDGDPQPAHGFIEASHVPGLGVKPRREVLGEPVAVYC